ncbi:MAG: MarR family transcriptional regulator [Candidatus Cloacimonetes bacterium]|jgi:DNA-binding MarR family transcriptional regulator|nr:MarR family transcriptional regulator [Candidatus Cloacimonadota bacterium]MBT6994173.1 MarR family transcriptional regulator [Candidatus Cloacimonadota bacterium]MBT7469738.1 MarR family transcriptional regulator [Candidatus Cloacimonadota bacterium]
MNNTRKFKKIADLFTILYKQNDIYHKQCTNLGRSECNMVTFLNSVNKPVCMKELAEELCVTQSRITRLVDSLVAKGFVNRSVSKQDRRKYLASISKYGKKVNNQVSDELQQIHKDIVKALPTEKLDDVYECLTLYLDIYFAVLKKKGIKYES